MSLRSVRNLTVARSTGSAFLLVRSVLLLVSEATVLTALPHPIALSRMALLFVVPAILPALFPRTRITTVVILLAVLGWLAATTAYGEPVSLLRLIVLASLLYLTHSTAALAAVLPNDAVVAPAVFRAWGLRTGLVVLLTAAVALVAVAIPHLLGGTRFLVASLAGFVVLAALAYYLAKLANRS